ncbi:M6 family metalloprotease domain-containing protein [Pseudonocardia nigra]|uniref:M6 family metalloprotease domain-containing protein n=1 Tax=Pseudonocardia nigra TaxID=1921578 RepID=UPI001C5E618A|nr:M6 family metalloprotease domain-containing protein [Pseudonocardia nigra]
MPLDPRLLDRVIASKRALYAGEQLPDRPSDALLDPESLVKILARPAGTRPDTLSAPGANLGPVLGSRKVLVLLVDFPDAQATQDQQRYRDLLFSLGTYATGSMRDFYQGASYGQLDVDGTVNGSGGAVAGWYRAPQPKSYYTGGNFGFGSHPQNAQGLVEDVLDLAAADVDFSGYDKDGDGVVEALVLVCAGSGAEQTGNTNDLWSHKWGIQPQVRNGVTISTYFMAPEDGRVGVMAHELGHLLLGWPDLYDTDYSSAGTGRWDLMAAGSWNGAGDRPAHPTAWCKLKAGWVTPVTVFGGTQEITLEPYGANAQVVKLPVGSATAQEYFLLSNRRQDGFDDQIPASGMLIEHCDDSRSNNTDESHYLVDVEQCDGRRDLNLNANRGDADDVFPSSTNTTFDPGSTPSSRSYAGSDSGVAVTDITRTGNDVSARVSNSATTAGPQWLYNQRIRATYAHHTEQFAWVDVEGIGWRRLKDGAADGVGNLFDMCNEAVAHGRPMHVSVDGEWLYTAYLI